MQGICRYCGQTMFTEWEEDKWLDVIQKNNMSPQDIADENATLACKCKQGLGYRKRKEAVKTCGDNIEAMFREHYPEVADILQEAKELVYGGNCIKKLTVTMPEGAGIASISYGKTGLKIEHRKLLHAELSTGLE